jgi:hypothetical protein
MALLMNAANAEVPGRAEPKPLAGDVAKPPASAKPTDEETAAERARLQAQLQELLKRLVEQRTIYDRPPPIAPAKTDHGPAPAKPKFDFPEGIKPVNALGTATNLFRINEIDAAYRAFGLIDTTAMSREDRAFVQYMTGCCLRKMNKRSRAAEIFRDLADAKEDEFIAECAVGQLALMQSAQELEAQLEQIRARAKPR